MELHWAHQEEGFWLGVEVQALARLVAIDMAVAPLEIHFLEMDSQIPWEEPSGEEATKPTVKKRSVSWVFGVSELGLGPARLRGLFA